MAKKSFPGNAVLMAAATGWVATVAVSGCGEKEGGLPAGDQTVALLKVVRHPVTVRAKDRRDRPVAAQRRVEAGSAVACNGGRAFVIHDTGVTVLVSGRGVVSVDPEGVRLKSGRIWVETPPGPPTTVSVGGTEIRSNSAGYELLSEGGRTSLYVVRGSAFYKSGGAKGEVHAGYRLVLSGSKADVQPVDLWEDWTGGLAWPQPQFPEVPVGLGEIGARRPGSQGKARFPLAVRKLEVKTVIKDDLAITRVEQVFFNPVSERLEGIYRIRIPRGAILQSFGIDRDGKTVWGYIKEKQQAKAQYSSQVYQGSTDDPALLTWEAPGQYKAFIYPIDAGSVRKVSVIYTQWLRRHGEVRTWTYPLGSAGTGAPRIGELGIEVNLVGAGAQKVNASLGAEVKKRAVYFRRSDYAPRADLTLTLSGPSLKEKGAKAYRVSGRKDQQGDFFMARILPLAHRAEVRTTPLDLVLVVDVSAATDPTRLHLARTMVEALAQHLGTDDRFALLGGDLDLRGLGGARKDLTPATAKNVEHALDALARQGVGGATDMGAMLTRAAALADPARRSAVVYIGDALPTVGELDLKGLKERMGRLPAPLRLYGVAIGDEADLGLLAGLAGSGGLAVRIEDRAQAARAALRFIAHMSRRAMHKVTVDLGGSIERVYPRTPVTVVAGDALTVLGRVRTSSPRTATVTGILDGKKYKKTYRLELIKLKDAGDLRLRWASKRLEQLLREGAGREEMVELGTRFGLITPYTSFYVPSARELRDSSEEREKTEEAQKNADESIRDMKQKVVIRGKGYSATEVTAESRTVKLTLKKEAKEDSSKDKAAPAEEKKVDYRMKPTGAKVLADGERGADRAPLAAEPASPAKSAPPPPASGPRPATGAVDGLTRAGPRKLGERRYRTAVRGSEATKRRPSRMSATIKSSQDSGASGAVATTPVDDGRRTVTGWESPAEGAGAGGGGLGGGFGAGGRGRFGGKVARVKAGSSTVHGALDRNVIRRVVRRHMAEVKYCYVSKGLASNPRLAGNVKVQFAVDRTGRVRVARVASATLNHPATQQCITSAVRRWRFPKPSTGGMVLVNYPFEFQPGTAAAPSRRVRVDVHVHIKIDKHKPKRCSPASKKSLTERRGLWRERLRSVSGVRGVLEIYQDALFRCELPGWRDRRVLLSLMLDRLGSVRSMLRLFRFFRYSWGAARYLALSILGRVRTPNDLKLVLGTIRMGSTLRWSMVQAVLNKAKTPELRLAALRRFLEQYPGDVRFKTALLDLLESMGKPEEAFMLFEDVEGNPYVDADFRVAAAEFLLRRGGKHVDRAKRILSEMVEFRPTDPVVRRRLGDLYRAYGWFNEAYRQYLTLASLRPQDPTVLLLMASAAAGAGRIDEALRLEQRVAATSAPGSMGGVARWALLWSSVRLMKLRWAARQKGAEGTEALAKLIARTRRSGVLDMAQPFRVVLTWSHPAADVELYVGSGGYTPTRPSLLGSMYGIEAYQARKKDRGGYKVEVRRVGKPGNRVVKAELLVLWDEGKPTERLWYKELTFKGKDTKFAFRVSGDQVKEVR